MCSDSIIIYGKSYKKGCIYFADEMYYFTGSYYEIMSVDGVYIGQMDESIFERYFIFIGGVLREVEIMFNKIMDGK